MAVAPSVVIFLEHQRLRPCRSLKRLAKLVVVDKVNYLNGKCCGDFSVIDGDQVVPVRFFPSFSEIGRPTKENRIGVVKIDHYKLVMNFVRKPFRVFGTKGFWHV